MSALQVHVLLVSKRVLHLFSPYTYFFFNLLSAITLILMKENFSLLKSLNYYLGPWIM